MTVSDRRIHAVPTAEPERYVTRAVMKTLGVKREQGELIRDPSLPLLEQGNDLTDRPRRLAEDALRRRGRKHRSETRTIDGTVAA